MRARRLTVLALTLVIGASAGVVPALAADEEQIDVVFVTASQPNDPFWNVVKRGAEDAGKDSASTSSTSAARRST